MKFFKRRKEKKEELQSPISSRKQRIPSQQKPAGDGLSGGRRSNTPESSRSNPYGSVNGGGHDGYDPRTSRKSGKDRLSPTNVPLHPVELEPATVSTPVRTNVAAMATEVAAAAAQSLPPPPTQLTQPIQTARQQLPQSPAQATSSAAPALQKQLEESTSASIDLTRNLVKKFIADIWNRGEVDLIPEVCSPSLRFNGNTGFDRVGHDGLARMVATIRDALDDYHCEIHSMVVEHNKAFCRLRFTGKHTGNLLGYPPTGRVVGWMGATEFTCQNGKILKVWELGDIKTLEEQLIAIDQPMDGNDEEDDDT